MTTAQRDIARKLAALSHADQSGNVSKTCRYFGISRETFYQWRRAHRAGGEPGLVNRRPGPRQNLSRRVAPEVEAKILEIRKSCGLGVHRLSWYLARYCGMKVSTGGVQTVLKRNGLNRLPDRRVARALVTEPLPTIHKHD